MNAKFLRLRFTTIYFLECSNGYLQIDTGYHNEYGTFLRKLRDLGITLPEIKYLLLTHHHDDHVGFAQELLKNSKARLIVHKNAVPFLETGGTPEEWHYLNWCIRIVVTLFSSIHSHEYQLVQIRDTDFIVEGDSGLLRRIGIDGEIVHTPGHSVDSISVVSGEDAFVGDLAMNFLNFCRIRYRPIIIQNIEDVYRNWELLAEKGVKTIYPAHGSPFSVDELIRARKELANDGR
jgi:glyoxylase-like metal-dependent hydrolase (beta-lactamase superfamily II)